MKCNKMLTKKRRKKVRFSVDKNKEKREKKQKKIIVNETRGEE